MLYQMIDISSTQAEIIDALLEANNSIVNDLTDHGVRCTDPKMAGKVINAYNKYKSLGEMKMKLLKAASEDDDTKKLFTINENAARAILYFSEVFRDKGIEIDPKILSILEKTKEMASTLEH